MALYPAPDMRTGAISLWVAGEAEAERAAEIVRGLGHTVVASATMTTGSPPRGRCAATLRPPPDKSISHRAALIGAMAEGATEVEGYLDAADTALDPRRRSGALGAEVDSHGGRPGAST